MRPSSSPRLLSVAALTAAVAALAALLPGADAQIIFIIVIIAGTILLVVGGLAVIGFGPILILGFPLLLLGFPLLPLIGFSPFLRAPREYKDHGKDVKHIYHHTTGYGHQEGFDRYGNNYVESTGYVQRSSPLGTAQRYRRDTLGGNMKKLYQVTRLDFEDCLRKFICLTAMKQHQRFPNNTAAAAATATATAPAAVDPSSKSFVAAAEGGVRAADSGDAGACSRRHPGCARTLRQLLGHEGAGLAGEIVLMVGMLLEERGPPRRRKRRIIADSYLP